MVLYPHVQMTLLELAKRGIRLGVVSDAPRAQVWQRLCSLGLQHVFDVVVTFDDTQARKQPDWTFEEPWSGRYPADRLDDHRSHESL